MALFKANFGIDMLTIDFSYGEGGMGTYSGSFSYDDTGNVYGHLDGYTVSYDGVTWYSMSELDRDMQTFESFVDGHNEGGPLQYLLSGNDRLTGSHEDDRLLGFAGDDVLRGGGGVNMLFGMEGNDVLAGGSGNDRLDGGAGSDRALYTGTSAVTVNLGLTRAQDTGHGWDTLTGIEHLTSGSGNDRLIGNGAANSFSGGAGRDVLKGGGGNDRLLGGSGTDALAGGSGNDRLDGGAGRDILIGGSGSDEFRFRSVAEAGRGSQRDTIRDFQVDADEIDLSAIDANVRFNGNQSFEFIGASLFGGKAGELNFRSGIVSGDTDGDKIADFEIAVISNGSLDVWDFEL